jgi:hypothetical protein
MRSAKTRGAITPRPQPEEEPIDEGSQALLPNLEEENTDSPCIASEAEAIAAPSKTKCDWSHKRAASYYIVFENIHQESAMRSTMEANDWEDVDGTTPG